MHDLEEQIHELAEHYFADSEPVMLALPQQQGRRPSRRSWLVAAAVVAVVAVAAGLVLRGGIDDDRVATGSADPLDINLALEDALVFRLILVNQTGAQHLSLSDFVEIGAAACGGAVNAPDGLLSLAAGLNLDAFAADETVASSIWLAARQVCPEQFTDLSFESGPPFGFGEGGRRVTPVQLEGVPDGFPNFVDLTVLDEATSSWAEGEELLILSATALTAEDAVQHFRHGFPNEWSVNEVLGPVTTSEGLSLWSIDVEGDRWSGVVDILSGDFGDPARSTSVTLVFAVK